MSTVPKTQDLRSLIGRFDPDCIRYFQGATSLCQTRSHFEISPEHLLLRLLDDTTGDVTQIFNTFKVDRAQIRRAIQQILEELPTGHRGKPALSPKIVELFQSAGACAPPFSVLLADAKGDLAHLEAGAYGVSVNHHYSQANPGSVFAVNCYLSKTLVEFNAPNAVIEATQNNNLARRERGQQLSQQLPGELDVAALARVLSDHANRDRDPLENPLLPAWGYSICNHGTRHLATSPHE